MAGALLTMKPHLGLLMPAALLTASRWHQIAVASGLACLIWLAGEWSTGLTAEFFTSGVRVQLGVLTNMKDQPYFTAMPSTYVALRHLPFAWTVQIGVSACAIALCWKFRHLPLDKLAFPLATTTFLVLPYAFAYDMGVVSLAFAALLHAEWREISWPRRLVAIAALMTPAFPAYAPPILLAGLYAQREVLLGRHALEQ